VAVAEVDAFTVVGPEIGAASSSGAGMEVITVADLEDSEIESAVEVCVFSVIVQMVVPSFVVVS